MRVLQDCLGGGLKDGLPLEVGCCGTVCRGGSVTQVSGRHNEGLKVTDVRRELRNSLPRKSNHSYLQLHNNATCSTTTKDNFPCGFA